MHQLLRHRLFRHLQRLFANLPRRIVLTWRYHGPRETLLRVTTFPLRMTPIGRRYGLGARSSDAGAGAFRWYRRHGRPVAIVIPTYGSPDLVIEAVKSLRATTRRARARIVVVDDGSAPEHVARLRQLSGVLLVLGGEQRGFAVNVNRGLAQVAPGEDVVLLNSDVIAHHGWLQKLQYGAYRDPDAGIAGPKLLYADGTIQSAGSIRNPGAPEWFDHLHRFKPAEFPQANVPLPMLGMTGAALYIKRRALDELGGFDEGYGMAFEDMDYCVRAWEAGFSVVYYPPASLTHLESKTRGLDQGARELESQARFWRTWKPWFDERNVRTSDGRLRIVYVTEGTGVGGGHRVVFQHLEGLAARGHAVELWSLDGPPDWIELSVPVRRFEDYPALTAALSDVEAIKVATWWATAPPVWRASVRRGVPVYFVQDIETSYYAEDHGVHAHVLATYRPEFKVLTTSQWVSEQLHGLGIQPTIVSPGLDLDRFYPLGLERHASSVLALGRSNPLKNFPLTLSAYEGLAEPRPELWLYGIEPELGAPVGARYHVAPSDAEVNELLNTATVFVQTSRHEGFCLPVLEAMATGVPVVCTDAHGNRDFCLDGANCLIPDARPESVRDALQAVLGDPLLRARLSAEGRKTALRYDWAARLDDLERFFESVAR
jgi:GT2 family glycosyltransferase/glycosyltransferase involved in cell wall biosynthesis